MVWYRRDCLQFAFNVLVHLESRIIIQTSVIKTFLFHSIQISTPVVVDWNTMYTQLGFHWPTKSANQVSLYYSDISTTTGLQYSIWESDRLFTRSKGVYPFLNLNSVRKNLPRYDLKVKIAFMGKIDFTIGRISLSAHWEGDDITRLFDLECSPVSCGRKTTLLCSNRNTKFDLKWYNVLLTFSVGRLHTTSSNSISINGRSL